jgi:TPR repeat protein
LSLQIISETYDEEVRAWRAMDAGDFVESARLFEPLAARGSAHALLCLGWMHEEGHLGPPDREKAISLWDLAVKAGSSSANSYLLSAMRTEEHRAFDALEAGNYAVSARLFEPLAARGSETALLNLGWMYCYGRLGPPDREKAIALWEEAARGGSAAAKHYLGRAFKKAGDLQRARSLFIEGAEQGNTACMNMVGRMLVRGQGGDADFQTGVAWLTRAADSGQVYARRELFRLEALRTRSWLRRVWVHGEMIRYVLSFIPRYARNPYSDDFR